MTALPNAAPRRAPVTTPRGNRRPGARARTSPQAPGSPQGLVSPQARRNRPALRAVAHQPRTQLLPTWIYLSLCGIVVLAGIIGIVALQAYGAEASFRAQQVESVIGDLTMRHDQLVAEVAVLESPTRVSEIASTQLGLVNPEQPGFLTLDQADLVPDQAKQPLLHVQPAAGTPALLAAPGE